MKTQPPPGPKCKVTMQYRSSNGYVYEVDSAGIALAFHVSRNAPAGTGWCVAAHQGRSADAVVTESAATGAEALNRVEQAWIAKASELGLPSCDWSALATALQAVRAI